MDIIFHDSVRVALQSKNAAKLGKSRQKGC